MPPNIKVLGRPQPKEKPKENQFNAQQQMAVSSIKDELNKPLYEKLKALFGVKK